MTLLVLLGSLVMVTLGAEALVRGATVLALRAGVSALFVGLTVVGFGTSSPELAASLTATLRGSSDVSAGNVVGSNIFNIAVILGLTAWIHPIRVRLSAVRHDLLVALCAAMVPWLAALLGGQIPAALGAGLLVGLLLYVALAFRTARRTEAAQRALAREELESTLHLTPAAPRWWDRTGGSLAMVVLGLLFLVLGARAFVGSAMDLARALGISELVIGLTIVSAGTSLPELVTSVVAARRRNPDLAIGNVIGSNIFNVLGILGACALVHPQAVSRSMLRVDIPVMVLATLALLPILRTGGVISRWEGVALVVAYSSYLVSLFLRGG